MKYNEIMSKIAEKSTAVGALLDGDNPNMEEVNKQLGEIENLQAQGEAVKKATEAKAAAVQAQNEYKAARAEPPTNGGMVVNNLIVTEDETDKKIKAIPYLNNVGKFLLDVRKYGNRSDMPLVLRGLQSDNAADAGAFNLAKAIGEHKVGSFTGAQQKAISGMSEAVPADGGLLVQTDHNYTLMQRMYNTGLILQRVSMIPITTNSNSLALYGINETSRATGSRFGGIQGYWAGEGVEKTPSKPSFAKINFNLNKLVGLAYMTDELLQDAGALEAFIMARLPEELRFLAENAIFRGTGTGQPQGIIGAGVTVTVPKETAQAADTIVSENIVNMWARRWAGVSDYVWMANQDIGPQLHLLNAPVGTGGALVYMPPGGLSQSPYGTLYGRPVIETEYNSTLGDVGDIILFSPSQYQMVDKGGIQSASSIHVRFIYDETCYRFVYRIDGKPLWVGDKPLTPFQGTKTQSPFVMLAERA